MTHPIARPCKHWWRVVEHADAAHSGQGLCQHLHSKERRSAQGVARRGRVLDGQAVVAACCAHALLVSWPRVPRVETCSSIRWPTTPRFEATMEHSLPVPRQPAEVQ